MSSPRNRRQVIAHRAKWARCVSQPRRGTLFAAWRLYLKRGKRHRGRVQLHFLFAEEVDQEFRDAGGFFVLEPVGGFGEGEEFGVGAVTQTFMGHIGQKESVAFAPENTRREMDSAIRKPGAAAKESAIPIDHGSERTRLGPRGAVLDKIVGREGARAAGAEQRGSADTEVESGEESLGHIRKLEGKDIPASKRVAQMGHHIA